MPSFAPQLENERETERHGDRETKRQRDRETEKAIVEQKYISLVS